MSETVELKVGRRGEIYTTREVREKVGLVAGEKVIAGVEGDKLVIRPKPTALSLLEKPRVNIKPVTPEELSEIRGEIAEEIENR